MISNNFLYSINRFSSFLRVSRPERWSDRLEVIHFISSSALSSVRARTRLMGSCTGACDPAGNLAPSDFMTQRLDLRAADKTTRSAHRGVAEAEAAQQPSVYLFDRLGQAGGLLMG